MASDPPRVAATQAEELDLHNDHHAYLLGAGYSADAGLPLMWNFLQVMRDASQALDPVRYEREIKAMKYVFAFRREAATAGYRCQLNVENIEELFSLASALRGAEAEDQIRKAIAGTMVHALASKHEQPQLLVAIKKSLGLSLAPPPAGWSVDGSRQGQDVDFWRIPEYQFRAAMMCGGFCPPGKHRKTSIITFNYDTLVEDALNALGIHHTLIGPDVSPKLAMKTAFTTNAGDVSLYKLHGSNSWGAHPVVLGEQDKVEAFPDYSALKNAGLPLVIQPPTWRKDFGRLFSTIWSKAVAAMETATRLIIVGFSMPDTDVYVRFLLAAGLARNISLREIVFVNNARAFDEFRQRVMKCFREELLLRGELGFCTKDASSFFTQLAYGRVDIGEDRIGRSVSLGRSLVGSEVQVAR